jgi:hypothetical protein
MIPVFPSCYFLVRFSTSPGSGFLASIIIIDVCCDLHIRVYIFLMHMNKNHASLIGVDAVLAALTSDGVIKCQRLSKEAHANSIK